LAGAGILHGNVQFEVILEQHRSAYGRICLPAAGSIQDPPPEELRENIKEADISISFWF
jgi:hypothetical protein